MTPKEKAEELIRKFTRHPMTAESVMISKVNAEIFCDELIDSLNNFGYTNTMYDSFVNGRLTSTEEECPADYYREVKQIIKSLSAVGEKMKKKIAYNVQEVFGTYKENENLKEADIFHLYDTGDECIKDNTGYHDSRHFKLIGFNTKTMEKCELGRHDGLESFSDDLCVRKIRVYADGSFFISLSRPAKLHLFQCVSMG